MATTKKSTKAKTKKPVRQTKGKPATRAAKTTKKSVSTKVSKSTNPIRQTQGKKITTSLLTKLNVLSAVVSLGLATAAGLVMNSKSYELTNGLLTKDELASKTTEVLVPAVHHVYDVELRWALVTILVLSAILPILLLTVYKARYAAAIKDKVNLLRWVDMAVISALMVEVVALLSGASDIFTLKLIAGLMVVTSLLCYAAEKRNKQANRPVWTEAALSIVTGTLPVILIAGYAISTFIHGNVQSPWYVYSLYGVLALSFAGNGMMLVNTVRRKITDYEVIERNYLSLGILVRVAFAAVLIAGLR